MADKNNKQKKQVEPVKVHKRQDNSGLLKRPKGMNKILFRRLAEFLKPNSKYLNSD